MDPAIELRSIKKDYRRIPALRGVDLCVNRGEVFGFLGPNGAGKSTLVKIMMTVVHPTAGEGSILGLPLGDKSSLSRIGYLPENHRFPRYLTGRQVLELFAALTGTTRDARRKRAGELLEIVGMSAAADRRIATYSKGMMQRVGLAQAMMHDPELILLDEPTDGVDPVGRRDIRDVLLHLKQRGVSVFINSHLLSELEMVCDRVAILVNGAVARQGTLGELSLGRGHYEIATEKLDHFDPASASCSVHRHGDVLKIDSSDPTIIQPVIDALRHGGAVIRSVRLVRPSLEDLFLEAVMQQRTEGRTNA